MSDWYYAANDEQKGPINESELKAHLAGNQLPPDTLVWKEGMDDWAPANEVPAFSFRPPPMPAKVQPPAPGAAPAEPTAPSSSTTPVDVAALLTGKGETLEVDPDDAEKNKVFGILAYLSILWLVPLLVAPKSPFAKYHANQGLVLFVAEIVLWIGIALMNGVLGMIHLYSLEFIFDLIGLAPFALIVLGIINAAAGKCVPLPLIGGVKLLK